MLTESTQSSSKALYIPSSSHLLFFVVIVYGTFNKLGRGEEEKQNNSLWRDQLSFHNQQLSPFCPTTGRAFSVSSTAIAISKNATRQSLIQPQDIHMNHRITEL